MLERLRKDRSDVFDVVRGEIFEERDHGEEFDV